MCFLGKYSVWAVWGLLLAGWAAAGCGSVEQAAVERADREVSGSDAGEEVSGEFRATSAAEDIWEMMEIRREFGRDVAEGEQDVGEDVGEEAEESGCVQVCAMLAQCLGFPQGVTTEEECQRGCGRSLYEGTLQARDVRCLGRVNHCGGLAECMEGFWGCDEACDGYLSCAFEEEPAACRLWCGMGIMSGAVEIAQLHCMERHGRTQLCDAMVAQCGLDFFADLNL